MIHRGEGQGQNSNAFTGQEMRQAGSGKRCFRCYRKCDVSLSEKQQGKHLDKCQLTLALSNGDKSRDCGKLDMPCLKGVTATGSPGLPSSYPAPYAFYHGGL